MTYVPSSIKIIRRVPKTADNPYGCINVDDIPTDKPVLITLGGNLTKTARDANFYASQMSNLLHENDINGIDIYSIAYNFASMNPFLKRLEIFNLAGHKRHKEELQKNDVLTLKEMNEHEPTPNYIKQLFDVIFLPRISNEHGLRIKSADAIKNMRGVKIYAHCHGALVMWQLANYMREEMMKMGYSPAEIKKIQKELLIIQHSPVAPLTQQKFTTISFASAEDTLTPYHNNAFSDWLYDNAQDVVPCYFDESRGNIFIAGHLQTESSAEHKNTGLTKLEMDRNPLTPDGKIIFTAERNALLQSAKDAILKAPIKSVKELVNGNGVDFEQLKNNGNYIYKIMINDLRRQNLRPDYQK